MTTNYFEPALPVAQLTESSINPRRTFNDQGLTDLAASIKEKGIIEPLVVRPVNGHGFEIVAGARRFRASKLAGLNTVPAIVRQYDDHETQVRSGGVELESVWDGRSSLDQFNLACDPDRSYGMGQSMAGIHTYSSTGRRV